MKKFLVILCSTALLLGTISVNAASDGYGDGDIVTNPLGELFTTTVAPETTTVVPETTTEEPTAVPIVVNTIVGFNYTTTTAVAGDDLTEYAYEDNDYTYKASEGTGTMQGSVNGIDLKHMEWGDAADYGEMIPVMAASSKNTWSEDAYISFTFSTVGHAKMSGSIDVGGTKKGPRDIAIGYYDGDEFITLTTYTISKNKTMYTVEFEIPETLENQESVTIYVKLTSTTNIGGNEMTSEDYSSGGELAFNNFAITCNLEEPTAGETTTVAPTNNETTTVAPTGNETTTVAPTTVSPTTTAKTEVKAPAKAKIKKVYAKKKAAKKLKLSIKKVKKSVGYQVAIYKTKKNAKKNKRALIKKFVKRIKVTINSKKLKNKKILYVRARAYVMDGKTKLYGNWSKVKKVRIKK